MAQGTLPGFISALKAGLRPVALRNVLRASRAHPSFPFSYISRFIDSLISVYPVRENKRANPAGLTLFLH